MIINACGTIFYSARLYYQLLADSNNLNSDSIKVYTCFEYTPTIYDYDGEYYYDIISSDVLLKIVEGFYLVSPKTKSMFQKAYAQLASEVSELDNYVVVKLKKVK